MSIPLYPVPCDDGDCAHPVPQLTADAFSGVIPAITDLEGAVNAAREYVRGQMRRVQAHLTRAVNRGLRQTNDDLITVDEQLRSAIAGPTGELAGTLRGIGGIVGTQRAVADVLERTRPQLPAVRMTAGPVAAQTPMGGFVYAGPQQAPGASGSGGATVGAGMQVSGGEIPEIGEGESPIIALPQGAAEGEEEQRPDLSGMVAAARVPREGQSIGDPPVTGEAIYPPHVSPIYGVVEPQPLPPIPPGAVCIPCPAPIVHVTILPAPVVCGPVQAPEPAPSDSFAQGPPTGGGETVGFDPSEGFGRREPAVEPLFAGDEPPPPLADPSERVAQIILALLAAGAALGR
jgi:hypothetical protein